MLAGLALAARAGAEGERADPCRAAARGPAVEAALERLRAGGAAADLDAALAALGRAAAEAGLRLGPARAAPAESPGGIEVVELRLPVEGDAFGLPVVLDASARLPAVLAVVGLSGRVEPGGVFSGALRLRAARPAAPPDLGALRPRLDAAGCPEALPVLRRAAKLAAWRRYRTAEPALRAAADARRAELARALPARLVAAARSGGWVAVGRGW